MKKVYLLFFAIVGLFLLTACGKKEEVSYEVVFSDQGNRTVVTVKEGETVSKPSDPKRDGYIFQGWYSTLTSDKKYDFTSVVTSNMTLYAKWEKEASCKLTCEEGYTLLNPESKDCTCEKVETDDNKPEEDKGVVKKFTVKFFTDGGTKISNKTVISGNKVSAPTAPTKTGYKFLGWYLDSKVYNFNSKVTKDITLVAKWEKMVEPEKPADTPTDNPTEEPKDPEPVLSYSLVSIEGSVVGQDKLYLTKDGNIVAGNADIVTKSGKVVNKDIPVDGYITEADLIDKVINIRVN